MKTQIKRFSKSALAVVLTLCMLVSCMTVGIIATDAAKTADERVGAATQRYIYVGISNNYQTYKDASNYGFNFWGGTSGGVKSGTYLTTYDWDGRTYYMYRVQVYDDNNKAQFKGNDSWHDPKDGFSVTLNGTTNNAVFFSHSQDGWGGQFQQNYQVTSTASLSASKTSASTGENVTLTPSLSTNASYNVIKSTSYSVTTNPGSAGSVTSAGVFSATAAGTYTVKATVTYNAKGFTGITKTATATKTITVTSANTPLTAPSITYNSSSATTQTMNASKGNKASISWSAVSNAGSYEVYKGSTKVTTTTNTYYDIERGYSYGGTYTVKAVPTDTASYSTSAASNEIKFTFNKVKLTAPTVTVSKTDIKNGDSVTLTATDQNSGASTDQYSLYYYKTTLNAIDTFKLTSGTAKTLSPTTNTTYKVVAYPVSGTSNEYYTQSDATSATQIKVYSPEYKIAGEQNLIGSTAWSYTAAKDFTDYTSNGIFTFTTQAVSAGDHYFKLYDSSHGYSGSGTQNSNTNVTIGDSNKYSITLNDSEASFKVSGSGIFVIYYDSVNKKIWVTQNTWAVSTVARVKTYNLSTGAYNAVANATSTHGTASPASINVEKGQSTTLTATAKTGYSFVGWYTNEACTTTASGSYTSTSYSATPTANTTYYALFKQTEPQKVDISVANITGATITAKWNNQTKTNGESLTGVPVGASVTVTVTPNDNKYLISTTPSLTNGKFTVTASTTSITATLGDKLKVTCTTNNATWGTVNTDKSYAAPGETVTLSKAVASGTLKKISVYNASNSTLIKEWTRDSKGDMKVTTAQTSANQFTQIGISGVVGSIYSFIKDAGEALGAADSSSALGADDPLTFTMPSGAVTVTSTYEEYVGTSTWLYNGYDTSGNAKSGYYQQPMAEGSVGGSKYAYYNVTGRGSENYDQLFTVSDTSAATTGYLYFTRPKNWGAGWSSSNNPYAYFWNSSGQVGNNWPGSEMSWYDNNTYDEGLYKIAIPAGATKVKINDNTSTCYRTVEIDLTTTSGAYYLSGGGSGTDADGYHVSEWPDPPSDAGISTGVEYYKNSSGISFSDHWYTGGFGEYNANSHQFARPSGTSNGKDLASCKDDYYIVVLYPNTSYTFNNNTESTGSDPVVLWMSTLPGQTETVSSTVKVYAKDGTIRRDNDQPERNDKTYSTFEQHANTFVYSDSGYATHIGTRTSNDGQSGEGSTGYNGYTYDYIAKFNKGKTLYIETKLDSTLKADYYLYGYCINGKTYKLHTEDESATGTVREAFTVPEDFEDNYLEITPIYFSKSDDYITFYVENYDEEVMNSGWGNTVGVYPYYQDNNNNQVANVNNPFGGYPGQPMVFYNGNYYTQLPETIYANTEGGTHQECHIKGLTLGNNYWDDIHKLTGEVSVHHQTYDFDDLYKIYKEYPDQASNIVCSFKYRNKYNNNEPSSFTNASTYANGWEVLTDYYGRPVDVFGNILEGQAKTTALNIIADKTAASATGVVHVISQDYKSNCAGQYATEYAIYNTNNQKVTGGGKTTVVPSVLAIRDKSHFSKYDAQTRAFEGIYNALKADTNVVGKPVVITYEQSIWGGSDQAERCDARWYYSTKGASINANVRIEYSDDMGKSWTTDEFTNTNQGTHTGTHAYFTGTATTATDTPEIALSAHPVTAEGTTGGGYYTFNADSAGQYTFVGWYLLRDNYSAIKLKNQYDGDAVAYPSHAEMSKNGDIFVARFMKTASGQFVIHHEVHPQSNGYGDVAVTAKVVDANKVEHPISSSSTTDVTVGNTYIVSNAGNKIVATFTAAPYGTSTFVNFYATVQSLLEDFRDYDYIDSISINGTTATVTYDVDKMFTVREGSSAQTVFAVTHYSRFGLNTNISYTLDYTFKTRYYGNKVYHYTSTLTEQELKSYYQDKITDKNLTPEQLVLSDQFVVAKAPFESNYREDLTWQVDKVRIDHTSATLTATQVDNDIVRAVVYDTTDGSTLTTTDLFTRYMMLFDTTATAENVKTISPSVDNLYQPKRAGMYISQWNMYQLDSFAYEKDELGKAKFDTAGNLVVSAKSKLVAVSYSSKFNYSGYEDYAIVPVYSDTFVNRQEISDELNTSSATILTLTRNHWNQNAAGNNDDSKYKDGADRLYADFMLNYNYKGLQLSTTEDNIKVGFIVRAYTWNGNTKEYTKDGQGNIKETVVFIDKSDIDNKNRIEYCYGIKNSDSNAKTWGKNFEFVPFVIDTENASASGIDVKDGNKTYKSVYSENDTQILDNVTFYVIANYA